MSALLILATANENFIGAPRVAALDFKVYSLHFATQSRSPSGRKRPAALRLPSPDLEEADCASLHLFGRFPRKASLQVEYVVMPPCRHQTAEAKRCLYEGLGVGSAAPDRRE